MSLKLILNSQAVNFKLSNMKKIGAGGEGSVFLLRNSLESYALKLYHKPTQERFKKVRAAIEARPSNSIYKHGSDAIVQMAWPVGLVQKNGKDVGFAMPYINPKTTLNLDYFIHPILGKDRRHPEKPNLAVRLQIAHNLCSLVKSLHDSGHYFIDFKPANVQVYPKSLHICLIDCDSYSINFDGNRYPATAYSPLFINPIALVNNIHPSNLGEEQDNWAIAVGLFTLLNFALHPYDGIGSGSVNITETDGFVRMGLYAYGFTQNPLVSPKPQSVHRLWPNEVRTLFDKAFTDPQNAPSMSMWINCIKEILDNKKISRCTKKPKSVDHLKFEGFECMQCAYDGRQKSKLIVTKPKLIKPSLQPSVIHTPTSIHRPPVIHTPPNVSSSSQSTGYKWVVVFFIVIALLMIFN